MGKTAIVTDTNSGLLPPDAEAAGVFLIPMPFLIGGISCLEGVDCTPELFFEQLRAGAEVSTSQPAPESITALWERLLKEHDAVLHFPMTAGLSGSYQTARALAREYSGRVLVVDNRRISVTLLQSIRQARRLLDAGMEAAEVRALLEGQAEDTSVYIAVNTLEYLKKSGRVTTAGAAMAAVLNLKPVLRIGTEKLDAFRKARGMRQARTIMLEAMRADLNGRLAHLDDAALFAAYSGSREEGEQWLAEVRAAFPERVVELAALPLSICCHIGDGALAIACARK